MISLRPYQETAISGLRDAFKHGFRAPLLEGFQFIGIEREAEYVEIARARLGQGWQSVDAVAWRR